MTRIAKLNHRFLSGARISFAEFQSLLAAYGWRLDRITGSHHIYIHPRADRALPITPDGQDARRYQLRQARAMIERFALNLDDGQ